MASSSPIPRQYHRPGGVSEKVDDATIRAVVDRFYEIAQKDSVLGPVFDAHVVDWSSHLETMYAFGHPCCTEKDAIRGTRSRSTLSSGS